MKLQQIILWLHILCAPFCASAMELSPSRSKSPKSPGKPQLTRSPKSPLAHQPATPIAPQKNGKLEVTPVAEIYRELSTIQEEIAYLLKLVKKSASQPFLTNISYTYDSNSYPFGISLSCQRKLGWLHLMFCQAKITLHLSSCSSPEQFALLIRELSKFFLLSKTILENQILNFTGQRKCKPACTVHTTLTNSLQTIHQKISTLLEDEKEYWRKHPETLAFKTIEKIHTEWNNASIEKALKNAFGRDTFEALPDHSIAECRTICAQAILDHECYQSPQKALIKRLALISNTKKGKPLFANDKTICIDHLLGKKAFNPRYAIDTRLLILSHVSNEFIQKNALRIADTLEKIELMSPNPLRQNTIQTLHNKLLSLEK